VEPLLLDPYFIAFCATVFGAVLLVRYALVPFGRLCRDNLLWRRRTLSAWAMALSIGPVVFYGFLSIGGAYLARLRRHTRTVPAILIRKSTRMYGYDSRLSGRGIVQAILTQSVRPRGTACLRHVCWLTFRTREREMEFAVPEPLYASLPLTCGGTLTFKGDRLIRFERYDPQ
jgi:hypothetical protein